MAVTQPPAAAAPSQGEIATEAAELSRAATQDPTPVHLGYLDGLRAVVALFVVVHHVFQISEQPSRLNHTLRRATWLFQYGHFAVSVFIVISGFCLMMPVVRGDGTLRGGAAVFFRKRARRILPPYYVAMCLALLAQHVPLSSAQTLWRPVTSFGVLTHVLLVHNLWPATFEQINPVFWSVAVESQIYLLFPLLVLLWGRLGGPLTTLGSILVGYAAMYAVRGSVIDGLTPHYLGLFGLGMFGAAAAFSQAAPWQAVRERVPWARAASALGVVMLTVCAGIPDLPLRTLDFPIGLCAMTILVAALRPEGHRIRTCLSWKPLVAIGRFAYSLYLMHLPVLWLVARSGLLPAGLSAEGRLVRMLVVGPPIALIASYCFYLLVEQPTMAKRSRAAPVRA